MDRVRAELEKIMSEPGRMQSAQRAEDALKQVAALVAKKQKEKSKQTEGSK